MEVTEILPGDVLFVWGNDPIEKAIEIISNGPSHCALLLDSETVAEAQWNRVSGATPLSNYLSSGVKLEVWQDESLTDKERRRIVDYAKSHFGIEYDYLAILVELARYELDFPISSFHEGKRRICSSYVNDCAKAVKKNWADVPVPAPVDLLRGGKLTKKGVLQNAGS